MMNLILDASVVIEMLSPPTPVSGARRAVEEARRRGCRLWVVTAQLPGVAAALEKAGSQGGKGRDGSEGGCHGHAAGESLQEFLKGVGVLSSYGFQVADFTDDVDLDSLLLLRAADSLGEGTRILAASGRVARADPRVMSPDALLEKPPPCPEQGNLPFIDLKTQQARLLPELEKRVMGVLRHGQYIMGPEIRELEGRLARFAGARHAIGCSSGTDALLMALLAYGVGPGDAVFTSTFTFIATAEVISLLGATPVFVDVDPRTYNLDPEHLERAIRAVRENDPGQHALPRPAGGPPGRLKPRGIVAVDLFGLPAEYRAINRLAGEQNLFVIEDAAQSFGALYHGKRSCALTHVGCTSFFPAKPLGGYGDGGAVFTDDDRLAEEMLSIRVHGQGTDKYDNARVGLNGRLDTLQAAILLPKLEIFPEELECRNRSATRYTELLRPHGAVQTPEVPAGLQSAWAQYSIQVEGRDRVQEMLKKAGIPTAVYYPKPLHLQTAFASLGYRAGDFPVSESVSRRILSLPMHPYLREEQIHRIVGSLSAALRDDRR